MTSVIYDQRFGHKDEAERQQKVRALEMRINQRKKVIMEEIRLALREHGIDLQLSQAGPFLSAIEIMVEGFVLESYRQNSSDNNTAALAALLSYNASKTIDFSGPI